MGPEDDSVDERVDERVDEHEAERLAALDQAIASGRDPAGADGTDVSFLKLLREHWPAHSGRDPTSGLSGGDTVVPSESFLKLADLNFRLGRFEILRELGRGGFGVVFLARDHTLDRLVALKVPATFVVHDAALTERFQREARMAAGLDHPHIVPVFEAGEEASICYIASAYCPGLSLAEWLRLRTEFVPVTDAARLVAVLADAVAHAHQRGVLHRDIKPGNVLLVCDEFDAETNGVGPGEPGSTEGRESLGFQPLDSLSPRITDFGLARLLDADSSATQSGAVLGTPNYMAPEQAAGRTGEFGPAADVYALGAVCYELLTGRPPFQGETSFEIIRQTQTTEPVPPSRIRPRIPHDLETICLHCLEKEPRQRYATARELAEDLRRFLTDRPIQARPVGPAGRIWRWAHRNRLVAGLAATLLAILTTSLIVVTTLWLLADSRREQAEYHAHDATRQRERAESSYRLARIALASAVNKVVTDPRVQSGALEDLKQTVQGVQADFYRQFVSLKGSEPAFEMERGRALVELGKLVGEMGERAQAIHHLRQAVDVFDKLVQADPKNSSYLTWLSRSRLSMAGLLLQSGEIDNSEEVFVEAARGFRQLWEQGHSDVDAARSLAGTYSNLGNIYFFRLGRAREGTEEEKNSLATAAIEQFQKAADVLTQLEAFQHEPAAYTHGAVLMSQATVFGETKQWDHMAETANAALLFLQAVPADGNGQDSARMLMAECHNLLAIAHGEAGRRDAQRQARLDGLTILENLHADHPQVTRYAVSLGNHLSNFGVWYREGGQPDEAREWFTRAIETLNPLLERNETDIQVRGFLRNAHKGMAESLTELGRDVEALPHWEKTLEVDSGQYQDWFSLQKARTLARLGHVDDAVGIAEARLTRPNPSAQTCFDAGCVYAVAAARLADEPQRQEALCVRAMQLLAKAQELDFDKPEELLESSELDILRPRPEFEQLVTPR